VKKWLKIKEKEEQIEVPQEPHQEKKRELKLL
jgi:hypothetical protein